MTDLDVTDVFLEAIDRGAIRAEYDYTQDLGLIDVYVDDVHVWSTPLRSMLGPKDMATVQFRRPDGTSVSVTAPRPSDNEGERA